MKKGLLIVMMLCLATVAYSAENETQVQNNTQAQGDVYSLSTTFVKMIPGDAYYVYVLKNGIRNDNVTWELLDMQPFNFEIEGGVTQDQQLHTGPIVLIQSPNATGPDMYGSFVIQIAGTTEVRVTVDYR